MKERFKLVPAVYLLLRRGPELLLALRQNTGYADGFYGLVAGHLDGGESARAGLCREAKEEVGLTIAPEDLEFKLAMHRISSDRESVDFFFLLTRDAGMPENAEPDKCAGLRFFPLADLPPNLIPYERAALQAIEQGLRYAEYGWEETNAG